MPSPQFDSMAADYVETMLRNLAGVGREGDSDVRPAYDGVYGGQAGGHRFVVANAPLTAGGRPTGGRGPSGSVCAMDVGVTLPPLFVNLRDRPPFMKMFLKEMPLESEEFNRRFQVMALNREYAMDVLSPRAMELVMSRDDWVFFLEMTKLICVSSRALATADDYRSLVDAVGQFVALVPRFVQQDRGLELPTLPDGTAFDPTDPGSRAKLEAAVAAMSPDERREFMVKMQAAGARFVAGMFGKDVPEAVAEDLARKADEKTDPPTA